MDYNNKDSILQSIEKDLPLEHINVIDAHGHNGGSLGHWIPYDTPEGIIETLNRVGINKLCISSMKSLANDYKLGNQEMIDWTNKYPDKFIGLAVANPRYSEDIYNELTKCFESKGVLGIKIHPATYVHDHPINGSGYEPVWEFAKKNNCPVLTHAGPRTEFHTCGPEVIAKVASQHPGVNILIGHCGSYDSWQSLDEYISIVKQYDNLYLETSTMNRFYRAVDYMVNKVGDEKVIFGSDGPFHSIIAEFGSIVYARVSEKQKENILYYNIAKLLGIEKEIKK